MQKFGQRQNINLTKYQMHFMFAYFNHQNKRLTNSFNYNREKNQPKLGIQQTDIDTIET